MTYARWRTAAGAATIMVSMLAAQAALAQGEPKRIGTFRDWEAYSYAESNQTVCYAATRPVKAEGSYTRRDEVHMVVARRATGEEISIYAGYTYKPDSEVQVTIGADKFQMFTHEDSAWSKNPDQDKQIVAAMRKAGDMVVVGTSSRGTVTTDTYSLRGLSQALEEAEKTCAAIQAKAPPAAAKEPAKTPTKTPTKTPAKGKTPPKQQRAR